MRLLSKKDLLWGIAAILPGVIATVLIQYVVIPDGCYYHTHEAGRVIKLLYTFTADNGYHPFPSLFNFIITTFCCILISIILGRRLSREVLS